MALINLIARSNQYINWKDFLINYDKLNLSSLEIFPIPKELGFSGDAVGACIHTGYSNRNLILSELKTVIKYFFDLNLEVTELYDSIIILPDNVEIVLTKLLP